MLQSGRLRGNPDSHAQIYERRYSIPIDVIPFILNSNIGISALSPNPDAENEKKLIPHGAKKDMWGTNPLTVGVPSNNVPVILDMASSQVTGGDLLLAINEGGNPVPPVKFEVQG